MLSNLIDQYLGTPFVWRGRDPKVGLDCLGLALLIFKEIYGHDLVDPWTGTDLSHVKKFAENFTEVNEPQPGDILYFDEDLDPHVAIVENSKWAVHSKEGVGVERIRLHLFMKREPAIYRYKDQW